MPADQHFSRINTSELKSQIEKKLGRVRSEKYFDLLTKFLSLKLSKTEFNKLCIGIVGRDHVRLHNDFLQSILKNAYLSKTPPLREGKVEHFLSVKVSNGYQKGSLQSLCRDLPQSPRRGRTTNHRGYRDRASHLGPHGKGHSEDLVPKIQDQSATELVSLGSRPPGSVEDGEEVDQAAFSPGIHSRSPVRAPLGLPIGPRKILRNKLSSAHSNTCYSVGELPDTISLKKRLEQKLEGEGLQVSADCVNLLNNSLDIFLKGLIKPCIELAALRSECKNIGQGHVQLMSRLNGMLPVRYMQKQPSPFSASMLDFRLAMELNPQVLGDDWPMKLEKVCLRSIED